MFRLVFLWLYGCKFLSKLLLSDLEPSLGSFAPCLSLDVRRITKDLLSVTLSQTCTNTYTIIEKVIILMDSNSSSVDT